MANQTFLTIVNGVKTLASALVTSTGASDAGKIPALDASGRLDGSVMPVGLGADTKAVVTSEALAAGALVSIYDVSGTPTARNADATTPGKPAVGFVLAAVASGGTATVYFEGTITGLTGLTAGTRMYLDTTAGRVTATAPSASGNAVQFVGQAVSATEVSFEPSDPITLV